MAMKTRRKSVTKSRSRKPARKVARKISAKRTAPRKRAALPVPAGFHTVSPYLSVRDGVRAIDFYKRAFGAKQIECHAGPDGKIMYASLKIGDSIVQLADESEMGGCWKSPMAYGGTTVGMHIYVKDCDALWKQAVAAGAKVTMPLADQFWGDRYGKLTDPFGHEWSIATHKKDMTEAETAKAAEEFFSKVPQPA